MSNQMVVALSYFHQFTLLRLPVFLFDQFKCTEHWCAQTRFIICKESILVPIHYTSNLWFLPVFSVFVLSPCVPFDALYGSFSLFYSDCLRLTLTLSCPMDLKNFPMDIQTCTMQLESCESSLLLLPFPFTSLFTTSPYFPLFAWPVYCPKYLSHYQGFMQSLYGK